MSLSTHSNDKRVCKTSLSRSKDFNKVIWNKSKNDLVFPLKFLDSLGEDNALPWRCDVEFLGPEESVLFYFIWSKSFLWKSLDISLVSIKDPSVVRETLYSPLYYEVHISFLCTHISLLNQKNRCFFDNQTIH